MHIQSHEWIWSSRRRSSLLKGRPNNKNNNNNKNEEKDKRKRRQWDRRKQLNQEKLLHFQDKAFYCLQGKFENKRR